MSVVTVCRFFARAWSDDGLTREERAAQGRRWRQEGPGAPMTADQLRYLNDAVNSGLVPVSKHPRSA